MFLLLLQPSQFYGSVESVWQSLLSHDLLGGRATISEDE